jgi:uncharacterized protein YndB with AHSA1/START domain
VTTENAADLDLVTTRVIRAPRERVWAAWSDPRQFERWWLPAPMGCQVVTMDLRAGGGFITRMREPDGPWVPHLTGCFLDVRPRERIVFTNALLGGWRPAASSYPSPMTAIITFTDHREGTHYHALAMHADGAARDQHEAMGFHEGWGTVIGQLAALVEDESPASRH